MGLASWTDPVIAKHLLRDEGEVIVDEVRHHWAAYTRPALEALLAIGLLVVTAVAPVDVAWIPFFLACAALLHAGWLTLREHRDRFVITNMRVFRVHGVISQSLATMPLSRILDITVRRPLHGRLLGFGHFVFESAAREQGIRDIRYVGRPYERDLAIQRVVQRAGLRGGHDRLRG
ncbi:PH domain-containing protein [Nocardioides mangrovi]|uniref:PH domain-containing protein n=1 Tax=Nocardioides mangrovi TaxID=2874580 RepID=A0ABS7U724_9ACTN|nr:PH domain-containing protein [Nocardioides mangrovi]MBZ5736640.1 PH domain-containing protein [Nocardioides mangrovi]